MEKLKVATLKKHQVEVVAGLGDIRVHTSAAVALRAGFPLKCSHSHTQLQKGLVLLHIVPQMTNTIAFPHMSFYLCESFVVVTAYWGKLPQAAGPHPLPYASPII